jgi:hypothetical protein
MFPDASKFLRKEGLRSFGGKMSERKEELESNSPRYKRSFQVKTPRYKLTGII